MPVSKIQHIHVTGFRSLRDITLELSPVTVVIGANGTGKSNLLSVLRLISLLRAQSLRRFVGEQGGASALLHYYGAVTKELAIDLEIKEADSCGGYQALLGYAAGDSLIFLHEGVTIPGDPLTPTMLGLGVGHAESRLAEGTKEPYCAQFKAIDEHIVRMGFFHFHDTAPLRQSAFRSDDRILHSDGSNVAAFLYRLKIGDTEDTRAAWNLIKGLARRVSPCIKELVPDLVDPSRPEQSAVRLYWTDERDHRFDVHDLSDGTLRAIALFTALGQPAASRPTFVTIDEPELSLHPAALGVFAALVRSVSAHCQVLLATQSSTLLDEFEPEDIVIAERRDGASTFRRLATDKLAAWLEEFSLSELYAKNIL